MKKKYMLCFLPDLSHRLEETGVLVAILVPLYPRFLLPEHIIHNHKLLQGGLRLLFSYQQLFRMTLII